jgi:hypothetical protein
MKLGRLMRANLTFVVGVVALFALAYGLASVVSSGSNTAFALTSSKGLTITGSVEKTYASGTCTGGAVKLFPGTPNCLLYTVGNPLYVPIAVTSVTATVVGFTPAQTTPNLPVCTLSWVTIGPFAGNFSVPARSKSSVGVPIELTTTGTTQNSCQGGTFHFIFHASATFTDSTTTTLASTTNPSQSKHPVTLTAVVTPSDPAADPFGPAGASDHVVAFYSCTAAACTTTTLLATKTLTGSTASTKAASATFTSGNLAQGTYYFEARYTGTQTATPDLTGSHATLTQQVVGTPCSGTGPCLEFLTEPGATEAGKVIHAGPDSTGKPVVVEVVKKTGSLTTAFSGTVTLTLTGNPSSATLSGGTPVTVKTGLATFTALSVTHAGSYKLVATATRSPPTPATSIRFSVFSRLEQCTSHPCTTTGTTTHEKATVVETTTDPRAGYIALGFGGAPTFTCGTTKLLKGTYVATADVLTSTGLSTPQHGTTWTLTYTIAKTIVETTGPEGASKWEVCFADTTPFTALTGGATKKHPVTLTTGDGPVTYYIGLLRDCSKTVTAPCVASRHKTNAGQEVITVEAAGDSFVRP